MFLKKVYTQCQQEKISSCGMQTVRWKRPESVRWEMDSRVAASRGRKSWHVHHGLWSFSLWIRNWLPTCWCDFFNGFSNSEQTCESFIYLSFTHICSESLEPFLRFMGIRWSLSCHLREVFWNRVRQATLPQWKCSRGTPWWHCSDIPGNGRSWNVKVKVN